MNLILMVWAWDECTKSIYHVSMLHVYIGLFRPFDTLWLHDHEKKRQLF